MRQEAVVLSYLEWVRLIGAGAIRLDENRIVRWRPERPDPIQVVADLMLGAPDLGTSATSFVLAMLEPEVLDRMWEGGTYLGKRLDLDAVCSFHSFGETALAIHRHDAEAAGIAIDLTPLAEGWTAWVAAVETVDRRARGEALLAILGVPPCDRFTEAADRLIDRERCIALDDIARARDSMFYGWACVLNAQKVSTGVAPVLPADVKVEVDALRRDFDVDQPFLARAPRLCTFIASLAAEGDRPMDIVAMASLKQHERYVIKREGGALDLSSVVDDIRVLEGLDVGAAGLLVQALGERLPGELIQALRARGVARSVAPDGVPTSSGDAAARKPEQADCAEVAPNINQPAPVQPEGATTPPERAMVPTATSEKPTDGAVATANLASSDAPPTARGEAVTEPLQDVEVAPDSSEHPRSSSGPIPPIPDPDPCQTNPRAENPVETAAPLVSEGKHRAKRTAKPKSSSDASVSKPKARRNSKKKDQSSFPDI